MTTDDPFDMWYCNEHGKFPANNTAVVRSMRKAFEAALKLSRDRDAADLAALRAENVRLREALQAFMEPMRRYTTHHTWLKGDEDVLIAAYKQARAALAAAPAAGA